jgi:uncharacterized protein YndB with AHSA1/START domain
MQWFSPSEEILIRKLEVDLRVGGRFRIEMVKEGKTIAAVGSYREVRPPEKLVFTWAWEEWPSGQDSLVAVELRERGAATDLVLTHELLPSVAERDRHEGGWAGCMRRLARLVG